MAPHYNTTGRLLLTGLASGILSCAATNTPSKLPEKPVEKQPVQRTSKISKVASRKAPELKFAPLAEGITEESISPDGRTSLARGMRPMTVEDRLPDSTQPDVDIPFYFFRDRQTGKQIGIPDLPPYGCDDIIWNPSGTGIAVVRRYSTHYYGVLVYSRAPGEDFKEVSFARPDPMELAKTQSAYQTPFVFPMSEAATRFWIDDQTVSLVEIAEELDSSVEGGPPPGTSLFASYKVTIHKHKGTVSRVKLYGPAPFEQLARKLALD